MNRFCYLVGVLLVPLASGCGSQKMQGDDACFASRSFVRNLLKSPSSAEFASCSTASVTELAPNQWRVDSYVEAQNSFGASIRTPFSCTLHFEESTQLWVQDAASVSE